MFFDVEHSRGQSPPSRQRRENRHRFPLPEQAQHFDYFFGSSPKHAHIQPENLEILVNHLSAPPLKASVTSIFRLPIIFYLLPELESGQRRCFAELFFQRLQLPVSGIMCCCFGGIDHEQAWQNEPLSQAVRAHHGKQSFSPTMSAWIQLVPHRDCAHAGDLSHSDVVPCRHGSRP